MKVRSSDLSIRSLLSKKMFCLCLLLVFASLSHSKTPTDVFKEANSIKNCVAKYVLSIDSKNNMLPLVDIDLKGANPKHVYSLGSALEYKLRYYFKSKGVSFNESSVYPQGKITPAHVFTLMQEIKNSLNATNQLQCQTNLTDIKKKTPADVMQELLFANLWIDKLVKKSINPSSVYEMVKNIEHELYRISEHLGFDMQEIEEKVYISKITPGDVFQNATLLYQRISLSDDVYFNQVSPSIPYDIKSSGLGIRPSDVYTMSTYILYYVYSIENTLGMVPDYEYSYKTSQRKPADVFALYNRLHLLVSEMNLNMRETL